MLLLSLWACHAGAFNGLGEVDAVVVEAVGPALQVGWTADMAGRSWVRWGQDGALNQRSPAVQTGVGRVVLPVLGAKAGRTVEVQAVTETPEGDELLSEVLTVELPTLPAELPALYTSGSLPPGFVLTGVLTETDRFVVVLDEDGDIVWYVRLGDRTTSTSARPAEEGGVHILLASLAGSVDDGALRRTLLDGAPTELLRLPGAHHDFAELPDGRVAYLTRENVTATLDGVERTLTTDAIWLADPDGEGHTPLVRLADVLPDLDPSCSHQLEDSALGGWDLTHSNSLVYLPERDELAVLSHHLDTIWFFEVGTGALSRSMGRQGTDFVLEGDTPWWDHGHLSQLWDGGMLMFDNRRHTDDSGSAVSRWSWDEAGNLRREWVVEEPEGNRVVAVGDVDAVGAERFLVTWSTLGALSVVDAAGEESWRAEAEIGAGFSRSLWVEDLYALLID